MGIDIFLGVIVGFGVNGSIPVPKVLPWRIAG
jgi:hypothetical protein